MTVRTTRHRATILALGLALSLVFAVPRLAPAAALPAAEPVEVGPPAAG